MNEKSLEILKTYLPRSYIEQASEAKSIHENEIRILLEKVSNHDYINWLHCTWNPPLERLSHLTVKFSLLFEFQAQIT
jgi:hypothetical protein